VVDTPPKPEVSYSNAGESRTADWCAKVDQGSGEPERGRANGSSNGFSSRAREDCCRRSSKPDMMVNRMIRCFASSDFLSHDYYGNTGRKPAPALAVNLDLSVRFGPAYDPYPWCQQRCLADFS
jgi:hypothetical protein